MILMIDECDDDDPAGQVRQLSLRLAHQQEQHEARWDTLVSTLAACQSTQSPPNN